MFSARSRWGWLLLAGLSGCQCLVPVEECDRVCLAEPTDAGRPVVDAGVPDASVAPPPPAWCADAGPCTRPWALGANFPATQATAPVGFVVAHLDDDCAADVALADWSAVRVYHSQVDRLEGPTVITLTPGARRITSGDFNGDGRADLAVTHGGDDLGTVSVLLAMADGGFTALTMRVAGAPDRLAAADFNHDGRADLALTDEKDGRIAVLLSTGGGQFGSPRWLPCVVATPFGTDTVGSLVPADLDKDGFVDLVVNLGRPTGGIGAYLGNGDGTFDAPVRTERFGSMSVGDFNRDGKPDVFVHNAVSFGNGDGTFGPPSNTGVIGGLTSAADFNGDGLLDVAWTNYGGGASVLLGRGDGTFEVPTAFWTVGHPSVFTAADVTGDGRADLVFIPEVGSAGPGVVASTCH